MPYLTYKEPEALDYFTWANYYSSDVLTHTHRKQSGD